MSPQGMDSRQKEVAIFITNFKDYLKGPGANEAPSRIGIPEEWQKKVDDLLPRLDNRQYENIRLPEFVPPQIITELVSTLDSLDTWGKLDGRAFVTVARILLAAESCHEKEHGLFQLMYSLEKDVFLVSTSHGNKKAHQRLAEFKAIVGDILLFPLYSVFIDGSRPSRARRWVGILLCLLIRDSDENVRVIKAFPSQLFKSLGGIIVECNDRLLKGVAGTIIAETLTGLKLHDWSKNMKYFWPLGMTSYFVDFPEDFEGEGWESKLFKFIDDVERKHQMWESTGFNATNVTIGDCEIQSESTLVSLTDFISVYIPRRGAQGPSWLDVKACNVDIVDIYSPYTQEDEPMQPEEEKLVDLQIMLVDYHTEGYLFLWSSQPSTTPDNIAFTVKDIHSDYYADTLEKARNLARLESGRPVPGEPLSDLELPSGPHRSKQDMQAALEKRREAITSMADSPAVGRISCNQKAGDATYISVHQVESNRLALLGSPRGIPQIDTIATTSSVTNAVLLCDSIGGAPVAFARPKSAATEGSSDIKVKSLPLGIDGISVKPALKEAGLSQHLKALKKDKTIELGCKKDTLSRLATASDTLGTLDHKPTDQKKHLYESDSEFSELTELSEGLGPIFAPSAVKVKPSVPTKGLSKKAITKPTSQPPNRRVTAVVRKPLNSTKQVKNLSKVHSNIEKSTDIYELPSDDEGYNITPVKGKKDGKVKQNLMPVKGKDKATAKKSIPKLVDKTAPEAEESGTKKMDAQHRNNAGVLPSKVPEISKARKVHEEAKVVQPSTTLMKTTPKILRSGQELKKVHQYQMPQHMSVNAAKLRDEEIPGESSIYKFPGGKAHEIVIQRHKARAASKPSIQESGQGLLNVMELNTHSNIVSVQSKMPKVSLLSGTAQETENATAAVMLREAEISKGKVISVPVEKNEKPTEGETKEAGVDNGTDKELPLSKPNVIAVHMKLGSLGRKKLATDGSEKDQMGGMAVERKAKVFEEGPISKRPKEGPLAKPIQLPGRTRRAAADVALAKLKMQYTGSSQNQEKEEGTKVVDKLRVGGGVGGDRRVESTCGKNIPSTFSQMKLTKLDDAGFPDVEQAPQSFESYAEPLYDQMLASVTPASDVVCGMRLDIRGDGLKALISAPKEGVMGGVSTVEDRLLNHLHMPVLTGTGSHTLAVSQTKLQAALNPKTLDLPLDTLLNRKPQIISWGKGGPLNQGRLVDTSGARGQRSGLNTDTIKAQQPQLEEDSPSQRMGRKRQKMRTPIKGEGRPSNIEYKSPSVATSIILKHHTALPNANLKKLPRCSSPIAKVDTYDMLDHGGQSQVLVPFIDLPEPENMDNEHLRSVIQVVDRKVEDGAQGVKLLPYQSQHEFIPNNCHSIKENSVPLPRTPEGKRTDFWNEPSHVRNNDIGSEESTNVGTLLNRHASISLKDPKPQMKQMTLSEDVPPVLIKQSGKRIESATVDDPFRDLLATRPPPSSFLQRLNSVCNGSVSQAKVSLEDLSHRLPKPQGQTLKPFCRKPLDATSKHKKSSRARVVMNTSISQDPDQVRAVTRKGSLIKQRPLNKKPGKQSIYAGLTVPTKYGEDTELTLVNSSSPLYHYSETGTTPSSPYAKPNGDLSSDEKSLNMLKRSAKEFSLGDASDESSIQELITIFFGIGKLFEEDMRTQEASAMSFLVTFKSAAAQKVKALKRSREIEFDEYTKKIHGPVTKKCKRARWAAQTGLAETIEILDVPEGKLKGARVSRRIREHDKTQKIRDLCKERWEKGNSLLKVLEQSC